MTDWDAIVLAGGSARRLAGRLKPMIEIGGRSMLDRVLVAVDGARTVVVVGPPELTVSAAATRVQEEPPGGGPVCGIDAALRRADADGVGALDLVAIMAGDLPLLDGSAIDALWKTLGQQSDGVIYVDADDRPQWLCGVWRTAAVTRRLDELRTERGTLDGASLRALFGALHVERRRHDGASLPPYFDCDTDSDIQRAEEWLAR